MGIIVFVTAIIPNVSERPIHILRAEMPGPTMGKLVPRIKDTAVILYLIYMVMTVIETVLLCIGGMPFFESLLHSFGTAGTGGFGLKGNSIAGYSPYIQWIIGIFMVLFGVNFNLYYLIIIKKLKTAVKSRELWFFFAVIGISTLLITFNIRYLFGNFSETLRTAFFQVASIISTTGYATADFNTWPQFSRYLILLLMFFGGCAGSTAGGMKMSRIMMLFKLIRNETQRLIHPRAVTSLRFEGKTLDGATSRNLSNYFLIYFVCLAVIVLLLCGEPFSFLTNFSAAVSCFNNVGPGLDAVGSGKQLCGLLGFCKIYFILCNAFGQT